jgi:hypothetical protein
MIGRSCSASPSPCPNSRPNAVFSSDHEAAVVAGPVAVVGVHDVEERLLPRPDHAVGEVVRVRVAPLARDRVDRLHVVRAHLVEAFVRQRDDLVLPDARPERFGDVGVSAVDHGGGGRQQRDLVFRLDLPGVQHHLLAVPDIDVLFLQLEEGGHLGEVHADGLARHACRRQPVFDLRDLLGGQAGDGRGGAAHSGVGGDAVLRLEPRAVQPVVHGGRAEVPEHQFAGPGVQRVPAQLVPGPLADRDAGQVPDVVVVEHEQRAEPGRLHRGLGPVQAVLAQPGKVDPLLEVDVHPARRRGEGQDGTGHRSSFTSLSLVRRWAGTLIQRCVQWSCQAWPRRVCSVDLHHGG